MTQLYAPTLKEDPVDAEIASHRLLLRAAMMRKIAAGVYSFLPLGFSVLRKVEQIIREEMNAIGSQEMVMSIIQPGDLWHESGRWDVYGPELMRLEDRHGHSFALSPTQEELITSIIRNELRSYKELPKSLYHIQWKYRDEIRPRFGLLRGREFLMKDAYSFHHSHESLQEHYEQQARAYGRICERLGLEYYPVEADSGQIGGKVTREFMALAEAGEAELVYCSCGFAANTEVATADLQPQTYGEAGPAPTELHTPIEGTIAALAEFLKISEHATVKALSGKDASGQLYVLFIPGSHELGEIKVQKALPGFEFLDDDSMVDAGLVKGYMGPVGLPPDVKVVADVSLRDVAHWLVGANKPDHHLQGATPDRDFTVDLWADLACARQGDLCPECGQPLQLARGIEVGQVFQLGTKYSDSMHASFMAEDGTEKPFLMGCYGWGVTRSLAAVVEQYNDDGGIKWPISVAPAEICVLPLVVGDERVAPEAERIAAELLAAGVEVVLDDRDERAGVKFADADLIGWPYQLIVGKRGLEAGEVELKDRQSGEKFSLPLDEAVTAVVGMIEAARARFL
ncbi:MAG: proline--tRNA ligase [Coriobacteriales bacterium]|jgi:prolyl-tRNA synthetase|nr:proline--tRNA ligase [Coriobacteriales bacterium]